MAKVRAASMRPLSLQELAIARVVSWSDFRLTSHVSHNRYMYRTEHVPSN